MIGYVVIFVGKVFVTFDVAMVPFFVVTPVGFSVLLKDDTVRSVDTDSGFMESVLDLVTDVDTALSDVVEVLATEVDGILNGFDTEVSGNGMFCDVDATLLAIEEVKDRLNDVVVVEVIVLVSGDFVPRLSVVCRSLESVKYNFVESVIEASVVLSDEDDCDEVFPSRADEFLSAVGISIIGYRDVSFVSRPKIPACK